MSRFERAPGAKTRSYLNNFKEFLLPQSEGKRDSSSLRFLAMTGSEFFNNVLKLEFHGYRALGTGWSVFPILDGLLHSFHKNGVPTLELRVLNEAVRTDNQSDLDDAGQMHSSGEFGIHGRWIK